MSWLRPLLLGIAIVVCTVTAAEANQPPGPQLLLAEVSLLPLMILLSLVGGAYPILRALRPKAGRWRLLRAGGAVLAILASGTSGGIAVLVVAIFGVLALQRGAQMIGWGFRVRGPIEGRPHLATASPKRLLPSGVALMLLSAMLLGLVVVFAAYTPLPEAPRQQALRQFLTAQLAAARNEQARTGQLRYRPLGADGQGGCPLRPPTAAEVAYASDGSGFTLILRARSAFPLFPYNLLTSQPSYRADQTGKIRMIPVHDRATLCPADAPIIAEVGEPEIARMQALLASTESCR